MASGMSYTDDIRHADSEDETDGQGVHTGAASIDPLSLSKVESTGGKKRWLHCMKQDFDGERRVDHLPVYDAWEDVKLKIRYDDFEEEIVVTSELLGSKLQFAMTSEKERQSISLRLKRKMSLHCSDIKLGIVTVILQNNMPTKEIEDAIYTALSDKEIRRLNFESTDIFYSFIDSLEDTLKSCTVGVFCSSTVNTVSANLVGSCLDVKAVKEEYGRFLHKYKQGPKAWSCENTAVYFDKIHNIYIIRKEVDIDTVQYLHVMDFKGHLKQHCPKSKYVELDEDSKIFELVAKCKADVEEACTFLNAFMSRIMKKVINIPKMELEFLELEHVYLHLQKKLREVRSYLQISDHAWLWSEDERNFKEAEDIVRDSYCVLKAENKSGREEELDSALKKCQNKLKKVDNPDGTCHILYIKQIEHLALNVKEILEEQNWYEMSEDFEDHVIKFAMASDIQSELKQAFAEVKITFCTQTNSVSISGGQKKDVEDALKEFKACIRAIKKVEIKGLSKGIEELLVRKHVSEYVARKFNLQNLLFMKEGKGFIGVGKNLDKDIKLKENLESKCFTSLVVSNVFLETDNGKRMLDEHSDSLYLQEIMPSKESQLWYTKDKESVVNSFLQHCKMNVNFRKKGTKVIIDFLQTHGKSVVMEVEKKHKVELGVENGNLVFKGSYKDGEHAMQDLERKVATRYLSFEHHGEKYKEFLHSEEGKKCLDTIARREQCCWSMTCQTDDKSEEFSKIVKNGVSHLASWILYEGDSSVSIVEADFCTTDFDVVVVPIDDKMCGENIYKRDGSFEDYNQLFDMNLKNTLFLGEYNWCTLNEKSGPKNIVIIACCRICTSKEEQSKEQITDHNMQKALENICIEALQKNMQSIGFALPCNSDDTSHYVKNVIQGFLNGKQQQEAHLYLCVKDEARSTAEIVNACLCEFKRTRRIVSSRAEGFFERPTPSIEVTEKSFLEVGAECLVVAVANNLNLSEGYLSNLVNEEAGGELQKQISNYPPLKRGEMYAIPPGKLSRRGVKIMIFGYLQKWKNHGDHLKVLQKFVTDCLMTAEENGCKSVAFPALGTGKLFYPPIDVAKVMLDGVEKYVAESISCCLDTVFISAPKLGADNRMLQLLQLERKRRMEEEQNTDDGKLANSADDISILSADNARIHYTVINEVSLQRKSFGEYVHVKFSPVQKDKTEEVKVHYCRLQLEISCCNFQNGLKKAVKKMVEECERILIRSVYVHCSEEFAFSFADQASIIVQEVYDCPLEFKYLSNVTVVVKDETGFSNIEHQLLREQQPQKFLSSLFGDRHAKISWVKEIVQKQPCSVRLKLIGTSKDGVEAAKKEFETYLLSAVAGDKTYIPKERNDEMSAEINPGIVQYLQTRHDFYSTWKKHVEQAFDIQIEKQESGDLVQMKIAGLFESILKMEDYLEKKFPDLPQTSQSLQFTDTFQEGHFELHEEQTTVKIPVRLNEKTTVMALFAEEIQSLTRASVISEMITESGGIYVKCKKDKEAYVKSKFYFFKRKLEELIVRDVHFKSEIEFTTAKRVCKTQSSLFNTINEIDEAMKMIKIIGVCSKTVDDFERTIQREIKKACEGYNTRKTFSFHSVHVHIYRCDILNAAVDCIVSASNIGLHSTKGVSKCIANKAGDQYLKECQDSVTTDGPLKLTECRVTGCGRLKFKRIINVHCLLECRQDKIHRQLDDIKNSVINCICTAENLGMNSVAIPFICSGAAGVEIQKCAQQYIRALKECSPNLKNLQEVHFVDIVESNVEEVCKTFTNYRQNTYKIQPKNTLTIKDKVEIKVHLCCARMHFESVDSDGLLVMMDTCNTEEKEAIKYLLAMNDGEFECKMKDVRQQKAVTVIPLPGRMRCKFLVLAVRPQAMKTFESESLLIVNKILKETSGKEMFSIALPIAGTAKDMEVTHLSCNAIADLIFDFISQDKTCLRDISLYSVDNRVLQQMTDVIEQKQEEKKRHKYRYQCESFV